MATLKLICINDGAPTPFDGQYLVSYDPANEGVDPTGAPMLCNLVTTPDRDKALNLPTGEMFELWRKPHGIRADGKLNRPLTAFTVEIA